MSFVISLAILITIWKKPYITVWSKSHFTNRNGGKSLLDLSLNRLLRAFWFHFFCTKIAQSFWGSLGGSPSATKLPPSTSGTEPSCKPPPWRGLYHRTE
jgi:hypothetical protein